MIPKHIFYGCRSSPSRSTAIFDQPRRKAGYGKTHRGPHGFPRRVPAKAAIEEVLDGISDALPVSRRTTNGGVGRHKQPSLMAWFHMGLVAASIGSSCPPGGA